MSDSNEQNSLDVNDPTIEKMFKAGAHFGYSKSKHHPSVAPFIFGVKNRVEIFDLEKTRKALEEAKAFVRELAASGKTILFAGSKNEALEAIKIGASSVNVPYVAGRWIGGTLTNFSVIRGRVAKLIDLTDKREKGELSKYTKKERLFIDREIKRLEEMFLGILSLKEVPAALFIVDPRKEKTAVSEAGKLGMPIVALLNSDCDLSGIDFPIPANDSSRGSIKFFVDEIVGAIREGKTRQPIPQISASGTQAK